MTTKLLLGLALIFSATAMAAETPAPDGISSTVTYSRDANYIYRKQPWRVTFDQEQQVKLQAGTAFIGAQLQNMSSSLVTDTTGDLKAINDSVTALNLKLDLLVQLSGKLYGEVAPIGINKFEAYPSAVIVFGGLEFDKTLVKFVTGGGSVMVGAVFVPMQVERTNIVTREVNTYFEWNSTLVLIPSANAGPGVTTAAAANGTNKRYGVGLVWKTQQSV